MFLCLEWSFALQAFSESDSKEIFSLSLVYCQKISCTSGLSILSTQNKELHPNKGCEATLSKGELQEFTYRF